MKKLTIGKKMRILFLLIAVLFIVSCLPQPDNRNPKLISYITEIENGPIDTTMNHTEYGSMLLVYIMQGNALCLTDHIVTPWINENMNLTENNKWVAYLLNSYYAGCIMESDRDFFSRETAYVGNYYAFQTYNKIKAIDSLINVPFFDSLAIMSFRDEFKIRCHDRITSFLDSLSGK